MAITAGVLLVVYFLFLVHAITAPVKQYDPQRGQAVGCLMIIMIGLALLGVMLAIGVFFDMPFCVRLPFYITVFPLVLLVVNGIRFVVMYFTSSAPRT